MEEQQNKDESNQANDEPRRLTDNEVRALIVESLAYLIRKSDKDTLVVPLDELIRQTNFNIDIDPNENSCKISVVESKGIEDGENN